MSTRFLDFKLNLNLIFVVLVIIFIQFSLIPTRGIIRDYNTFPGKNWDLMFPEEQGMSSEYFNQLEDSIISHNYNIKSVLVIKNGLLLHEKYFDQSDTLFTKRQIYSVTKSIISTLMGITIDKGYNVSLDAKVLDFFPEMVFDNQSPEKSNMTIEDLLRMASGLEWDEWTYSYNDDRNDAIAMSTSNNWVKNVLDRPVIYNPDSKFTYSSGVSHVIGSIIQRAINQSLKSFATENLFEPIGILPNETSWQIDSQGVPNGGWGLFLTPRAMARIGVLISNYGLWNETQIVSSDWVENATKHQINTNSGGSYGYQWWIDSTGVSFSARGYKGQYIFVVPDKNLVTIFTSLLTSENSPYSLFTQYVIPAIDSTTTLTGSTSNTSNSNENNVQVSIISIMSSIIIMIVFKAMKKSRKKLK